MSHAIEPRTCADCGASWDAVRNVHREGAPEPGDFLVCGKCACCLVFDSSARLRVLTDLEFASLRVDERRAIHRARKAVLRKLGKGGTMNGNGKVLLLVACAFVCGPVAARVLWL